MIFLEPYKRYYKCDNLGCTPTILFIKRYITGCLFLLGVSLGRAQIHSAGTVGVLLGLGKPTNRIGIHAYIQLYNTRFQTSISTKAYYNYSNFGPPLRYWEIQPQWSVQAAWGQENLTENPFYYTVLQRRGRQYALGYAFQYYWNTVGTQQGTGTIVLQIDKVLVQVENDVFGNFRGRDRFRTGAVSLTYQQDDFLLELKSVLWTGETRGAGLVTCREPGAYPCRWGFKDISKLPFGNYSHGVLAAQVHYALPYRQSAQLGVGIDSEHIRHFVQNKLIHDMYFLPSKWVQTKNLHYPMLDENGLPYLYEEGQIIRKDKIYLHLGLNENGFY